VELAIRGTTGVTGASIKGGTAWMNL